MEKFCVFCGKKPKVKTMEHIIPQWLIKETGPPKRKVPLGLEWRSEKVRKFSFSQLKFPACSDCNKIFSKLETKAKVVMKDLVGEKPLSAKSMDIILTWLDKIRIGLWLGYYYLDKNIYDITPKFHIISRINNKDRMLLLYKTSGVQKGICFMFVNTPFFGHYPSCFGLAINQFYFINLSSDFLFSRRLGLPFPVTKTMVDYKQTSLDIQKGLERVITPLVRTAYNKSCAEIYQPIIPKEIKRWQNLKMYNTNYVKKFFKSSRRGKVLIKISGKQIKEYPRRKSMIWLPKIMHSRHEAHYIAAKTVLTLQNFLLLDMPSFDDLEKEEKNFHKKIYMKVKQFNSMAFRKIEKELK